MITFTLSHRKDLIVSVAVGLVVGLTIVATRLGFGVVSASQSHSVSDIAASAPTPSAPLMAQSQPSEVVALMLNSHNTWTSIDGAATTIWYGLNGDIQTVHGEIQIQQLAQVRLSTRQFSADGSVLFDTLWVSDGKSIHVQDNQKNVYTEYPLPGFAQSADTLLPKSIDPTDQPIIYRHPIAMLVPSPLMDYIYPTGLMQRPGTTTVVGEDEVAGRKAIVVTWEGKDTGNKAKYWVDSQTGMIIKALEYGGNGPDGVFEETVFTSLNYDSLLPAQQFDFQPSSESDYRTLNEFLESQP